MKVRSRSLALVVVAVLAVTASSVACQRVEGGRYVQRVFAEIDQVGSDVVYRTATDFDTGQPVALIMDIWVPRGDSNQERPVQLWMHGGGWTKGYGGGMGETQGYAEDAARRATSG